MAALKRHIPAEGEGEEHQRPEAVTYPKTPRIPPNCVDTNCATAGDTIASCPFCADEIGTNSSAGFGSNFSDVALSTNCTVEYVS